MCVRMQRHTNVFYSIVAEDAYNNQIFNINKNNNNIQDLARG